MTKRLKGVPNLPFAPIVAALFGLVAAILVFATPVWLLERVVGLTGLSDILAAARPPLGDTARVLIAVATGLGTFAFLWLLMRPIEKMIHTNRIKARKASKEATASIVASDLAEVAPESRDDQDADSRENAGRPPIFAGRDLGAPLMSDEALAAGGELFLDQSMLDQTAAAEVPTAPRTSPFALPVVEDAPRPAVMAPPIAPAPVAPSPVFDPLQIDIPERDVPVPASTPAPIVEASLDELLARLEKALDHRMGTQTDRIRTDDVPPAGSVESLRELIAGARKSVA